MLKRICDLLLCIFLVLILFPWFIIIVVVSAVDTNSTGLYVQDRVGQYGNLFTIYKFRTMHSKTSRISKIGSFLRKTKLDELPQLFNILNGNMSFVGPRPDLKGYYDTLESEERKILELKPGLTSEAALKYYNEEELLIKQSQPLKYNNEVVFPDKVKMNLNYYYNHSFIGDIIIILKTILKVLKLSLR